MFGACEGLFTCHALDNNAGKVYLFEPLDILFDGLSKTFESQIKKDKVAIIKKGLSDKSGTLNFDSKGEYICMANFDDKGDDLADVTSLDEFVFQEGCTSVDFIKMDIEGAEIKSIIGAQNIIKKFKPSMSIAVYHGYENAKKIKDIILKIDPSYKIKYGGCYMYERPYRPFMLYAYA